MALPSLIGRCRLSTSLGLNHLLTGERLHLIQSHRPWCPASAARVSVTLFRPYSSDREPQRHNQKVTVLEIPNPFVWFRTQMYFFYLRTYLDKDFSIKEFTEGAKQAFSRVSRLLSQGQFRALEGLVAPYLIGELEEKWNSLPINLRKALYADPDEIMRTTTGKAGIFLNYNGNKFVRILMRFWYLTSVDLPDDKALRIQIRPGEGNAERKKLLSAHYIFHREYTEGIEPKWIITLIKHKGILE